MSARSIFLGYTIFPVSLSLGNQSHARTAVQPARFVIGGREGGRKGGRERERARKREGEGEREGEEEGRGRERGGGEREESWRTAKGD